MYNLFMETSHFKKTLSRNLRSIRRSKGLTTADLARLLGVSQAKISYIENCKGTLSAEAVAVLSKRLHVPVTEFFLGLGEVEEVTGGKEIVGQLAHYGAVLLAAKTQLHVSPFEEVFSKSLGFTEDDRIHKGFCAALIIQAAHQEINIDQIFAVIGNNPFLIEKAHTQSKICTRICDHLHEKGALTTERSKLQIEKIADLAEHLSRGQPSGGAPDLSHAEISDLSRFVEDCLNAKK